MRALPPDRWRQVDRLFDDALRLPVDERTGFLARVGAWDATLAREVARLLDADDAAERALGESAAAFAAPLLAAAERDDAPPPRCGPYRLVREVGRGGMGAVYLAERDDAQFARRVAVKLVKRGMDTDEVLRRFRAERQILARLEHPNVARLYDGGASDDGRPYLAMEYVEGLPIDAWCDERRLDVDRRLALFARVCDAVQFAHRQLVVHRDLKPSNILVAADGEPKLLDFGIAKLLADDAGGATTQGGARAFTPEYASPEQILGEPVTTASDVYGLGVVLYQLLAGRRPFDASQARRYGTSDALEWREADPPSVAAAADGASVAAARGTTPERLARRLRGDLDAIVLRALERRPERRYGSPRELADDLARSRDGLPVLARRPTRAYRAGRFVRRRRVALGAGSATVAVLAALGAFHAARVGRERDLAERQRDKAEQVVGFLTDMLTAADPNRAQGDTLTVFDVLRRSEARLDTALAAQPAVREELWSVLGQTYLELGDYPRARRLLERSYAVGRRLRGPGDSLIVGTAGHLAGALRHMGERDSAERVARGMLAARRAQYGERHPQVGAALNVLGELRWQAGDFDAAAALFTRAIAISPRAAPDTATLALLLNNLGATRRSQLRFAEAAALTREALALRERQLGPTHPDVPQTMVNLAALLRDAGDYAAAESLFRVTLDVRRRVLGPVHPDVAGSLMGLGYTLQARGRLAAAESTFRDALALNRRLLGPRHPEVGMDLYALAAVHHERRDDATAAALYREAIAVMEGALGPDHPNTLTPVTALGRLLVERGDASGGEQLLRRAADARRRTLGPTHRLTVTTDAELGWSLARQGRLVEAESVLARSLAAWRPAPTVRDSAARRRLRERLAEVYGRLGRPERADAVRRAAAP
jgi:serine/threonine-protein kinase